MQTYRLRPEQFDIVAGTLRRRADSNIAEYISSVTGCGSLSFDGLVARFELLNEVAASVTGPDENSPAIPSFDVTEELKRAFARYPTAPETSMPLSLRELIAEIPEKTRRSKLAPHEDVIRELRKKRRTYQEIADFLRQHLQLSVAPGTVHDYLKGRANRAKRARPPK